MARDPRVAVVVDSGAGLPVELAQRAQIYVVPMIVTIGGKTYRDGYDLSPAEFYSELRDLRTPPKTSAPPPDAFLNAFRHASETVESVICLTVSPSFSATHDSASAAVRQAEQELPKLRISVLDTESAAGGEALVAMAAWRTAQEGAELDDVVESAKRVIERVTLLAFLDTLYYLWRSGRVRVFAHAGVSLLRLKPLFEMAHGEVHNLAQPRTRRRAIRRLLELTRERAGDGRLHATVMHANAESEAQDMMRALESGFRCEELFISEFSPVMGAHTGPGLMGIAFWTE